MVQYGFIKEVSYRIDEAEKLVRNQLQKEGFIAERRGRYRIS